MAKVGLWLRGARGKYAGGVLQKGENGTVVRENVNPANPQTRRQMYQRVAFATVQKAAPFMLPIIGQSFENASDEKKNRREFIKRNVNLIKSIYQVTTEEIGDQAEVMAYAIDKQHKTLVPNPYVVSSGSLAGSSIFNVTKVWADDNTQRDTFKDINAEMTLVVGQTYTAAQIWAGLYGLSAGQQVTYVGIATRNAQIIMENAKPLRYGQLNSARLVLKSGEGSTITITAETTEDEIDACVSSLVETSKSDPKFVQALTDLSFQNNRILLDGWGPQDTFAPEGYTTQAAGFIISEFSNNFWKFSNCQLVCLTAPDMGFDVDEYAYGLTYNVAYPSYLKGAGSTDSDLYLEQGGDVNAYGE